MNIIQLKLEVHDIYAIDGKIATPHTLNLSLIQML